MLGCVMKLQPIQNAFGLGRLEGRPSSSSSSASADATATEPAAEEEVAEVDDSETIAHIGHQIQ